MLPASLPAGVLAQGLNHHAGRYFFRVLDVHPPLYYFAARIVRLLAGDSLQAQKLLTIVPMTLTLLL